jgi:pimeloyl-ACP methyl ester carboxylesterase
VAQPTVVLVHGAFAESASWNGVIARLRAAGHPVVAVANPLRSLSGDAAHLRAVLDSVEGPVVVAGHSYGGAVMSGAVLGSTASGRWSSSRPSPRWRARASASCPGGSRQHPRAEPAAGPAARRQHRPLHPPGLYHQQFAADLPEDDAALDAATQRPLSDVALDEGAGAPAWPHCVLVRHPRLDRNIPVAAQRFMAERAGAHEIVELAGASHAVPASRPTRWRTPSSGGEATA